MYEAALVTLHMYFPSISALCTRFINVKAFVYCLCMEKVCSIVIVLTLSTRAGEEKEGCEDGFHS